MRRRSRYTINWRLLLLILSFAGLAFLTLRIPPTNLLVVAAYACLFSFFAFILASFFIAKKYSYLIALTLLVLLGMNYFIGFQIINTLLLFSFMVGVAFLLK